jgi:hypothetical protein
LLVEAFILISELFTIPELLIGRETKTDSSKTPGGNAPESRIVGFQQWRKKSLLPEVATRSPFFIKIDPI